MKADLEEQVEQQIQGLVKVLVSLREASGFHTQSAFAKALGVVPSTIHHVESHRNKPSILLLVRWVLFCGARLVIVRPDRTDLDQLPDDEASLVESLRVLNELDAADGNHRAATARKLVQALRHADGQSLALIEVQADLLDRSEPSENGHEGHHEPAHNVSKM